MTLLFYAQPYDISAEGFFFRSTYEYRTSVNKTRNSYGDPAEEFEIQFIVGDALDCDLAKSWGLNQANFASFIEFTENWDEEDKFRFILAVGEYGHTFDPETVDSSDFEVDIHRMDSMCGLAVEFVEEGLFGDIPDYLQIYIDYDAIARDLSMDYSEAVIAGTHDLSLQLRCGHIMLPQKPTFLSNSFSLGDLERKDMSSYTAYPAFASSVLISTFQLSVLSIAT